MGLREKFRQKPGFAIGISAGIVLIAGLLIYYETLGQPHQNVKLMNSAFFSDDDGKTWFIDDASKLPPFDHDGKEAVRAAIYRYGDGKKFAAYLEKFPDDQKAQIEAAVNAHPEEKDHWLQSPPQVKKPGGSKWLSPGGPANPRAAAAYAKAKLVVSPDGSRNLSPVSPADLDATQ